jgi:hypothetical protein
MKDIGRSTDGNYIVELSPPEYNTIYELQRAIEGESQVDMFKMYPELRNNNDLSPLFLAVRVYIEGLFNINAMQSYLDRLKDTMEQPVQKDFAASEPDRLMKFFKGDND